MLRRSVERDDEVGLHAGVLLGATGAWAVIGPRFAGKTTLVHAAMALGVPVLSDDVAIIRGERAFAGPRCLDVRSPVPGSIRVRDDRHRVTLPPITAAAPLAGLLHLEWAPGDGDRVTLRSLSAPERLARLIDPDRADAVPGQARALLDVAADVPAWALSRSRLGCAADSARAIVELLEA